MRRKLGAPTGATNNVPRYFFHSDADGSFRDSVGTELAGDATARIEAARLLAQLIHEHPAKVWSGDVFNITVTDQDGLILFVLDLAAVASPLTVRE
jgi:hypothetical protein